MAARLEVVRHHAQRLAREQIGHEGRIHALDGRAAPLDLDVGEHGRREAPRQLVGSRGGVFVRAHDARRAAAHAILHDALLVVVVTLIATAGCVQDPQPVASTLCHRTDAGVDRG